MNRVLVLTLVFLAAAGLRLTYDSAFAPSAIAEPLRVPFTEFPLDIAGPGWRGEFVSLEEAVVERAGVSDYLNQRYTDGHHDLWVYVGYVAGYSPGSIHYPEICFPSSGRSLESKSVRELPIDGVTGDVPMNEYIWRGDLGGGTYTLSTFCYNGKFEPHAWRLRADRILGIRYFAIITISGNLIGNTESTRAAYGEFARRLIPRLLNHLPANETES